MFCGANSRGPIAEGKADYVPVFLSEIPSLFRRNILPLHVAIVQVSPPDEHGFCSLGVSVDIARAAVQSADFIVAMVRDCVMDGWRAIMLVGLDWSAW